MRICREVDKSLCGSCELIVEELTILIGYDRVVPVAADDDLPLDLLRSHSPIEVSWHQKEVEEEIRNDAEPMATGGREAIERIDDHDLLSFWMACCKIGRDGTPQGMSPDRDLLVPIAASQQPLIRELSGFVHILLIRFPLREPVPRIRGGQDAVPLAQSQKKMWQASPVAMEVDQGFLRIRVGDPPEIDTLMMRISDEMLFVGNREGSRITQFLLMNDGPAKSAEETPYKIPYRDEATKDREDEKGASDQYEQHGVASPSFMYSIINIQSINNIFFHVDCAIATNSPEW
jgi:hypothetical protein